MKRKTIGYTDTPAEKDLLGAEKYYKGLTSFIQNCSTPMTISIEGNWGTGKTTAMHNIRQKLQENDRVKCISMDMWPYALYKGESIAATFINDFCFLLQSVGIIQISQGEKVKNKLGNIIDILGGIVSVAGGGDAEGVSKSINKVTETVRHEISTTEEIKEFRTILEESIKKDPKIGENSDGEVGKLVVFIDDLDRLNPSLSIEIIETLKSFVDCKHCVFVLAIDFEIVSRGVTSKYEKLSDDKIKQYFHKVVQVQFHLPTEQYSLKDYLRSFIEETEDEVLMNNIEGCEVAIREIIGTNPRSIKRAFNLYNLQGQITKNLTRHEDSIATDCQGIPVRFDLALLEVESHDLYKNLVLKANTSEDEEKVCKDIEKFMREQDDESKKDPKNTDSETIRALDYLLGLELFEQASGHNEANMKQLVSELRAIESVNNATVGGKRDSEKVGEYVRRVFQDLTDCDRITEDMIKDLTSGEKTKQIFGFSFPMLRKYDKESDKTEKEQRKIGTYSRYWKEKYGINGKEYFLCNEWHSYNLERFDNWLRTVR